MLEGLDRQAKSIYAPIRPLLDQAEECLHRVTQSDAPQIAPLLDYTMAKGGKRIRPAITLLASSFHPGDTRPPILMAGAVELLHLATLIHDDTVDNSDLRRGKATVSNLWGPHVAVLFGDYVFAAAASVVCDTDNVRVIRRFSETIMDLASGELMEYFGVFDPQQSRSIYSDRIYRKTASLFRTAAETGAILSGAPEPEVEALKDYGYQIGMAYQIVDDLLDVQGDALSLGKPVGNDLRHGILTLPAIMLMERYPETNPIKDLFQDREEVGNLEAALEMIQNSDIVDDCYQVIKSHCHAARKSLDFFPDCEARQSLVQLADYIWERSH